MTWPHFFALCLFILIAFIPGSIKFLGWALLIAIAYIFATWVRSPDGREWECRVMHARPACAWMRSPAGLAWQCRTLRRQAACQALVKPPPSRATPLGRY